jgi:endonuclease/exonuclease/phosphatase family metal-dependent hydrolase
MMPTTRMLTPTLLLIWTVAIGCVVLLWTLPRFGLPRPEETAIVLGVCVLGGVCILINGVFWFKISDGLSLTVNLLVGLGVLIAVAIFVLEVFANEEGAIAVIGQNSKPTVPVTKIRLFDLNVLHGIPDFENQEQRFRDTVGELQQLDADILVLQEVWHTSKHGNLAERLGKVLGFNHVYARANGSLARLGFEEGSAILSRFPILEAQRFRMQPRSPFWENRIALLTKIDLGHETLTVVGVHLSNTPSADDQAEYLQTNLQQHAPDIIAGDLNAGPESRAVKAFLHQGFAEAGPNNKDRAPWIDHVFLSPTFQKRWHIKDANCMYATQPVPGRRGPISDHDGILVELIRR